MKAFTINDEREEWNSERAELHAERDRVLSETEEAAAIALERQVASAIEHVRAGVVAEERAGREELLRSWDSERARLAADHERAAQRMSDEHSRLRRELDEYVQLADEWEMERVRLNDECELASRLLAEARQEQMKPPVAVDTALLQAEVARVERAIRGIADLMDDPASELSLVIRKSVERAELEAYLRGIRFYGTAAVPSE